MVVMFILFYNKLQSSRELVRSLYASAIIIYTKPVLTSGIFSIRKKTDVEIVNSRLISVELNAYHTK